MGRVRLGGVVFTAVSAGELCHHGRRSHANGRASYHQQSGKYLAACEGRWCGGYPGGGADSERSRGQYTLAAAGRRYAPTARSTRPRIRPNQSNVEGSNKSLIKMLRRSAGSQLVWRAELLASAVKHARFQDLSRFRLPKESRGRPAWFVQLWWLFDALFVRSSPQVLYSWRRFWLRVFGAKIGRNVLIRPGVRVIFPWKVVISDFCWIGDNATLYNVAEITIGEHSVISQE